MTPEVSASATGTTPDKPPLPPDRAAHKYPKIQPAKPKNKPIPIAVLPKPAGAAKSTFNPNIKTTSQLKNDILNINTSRKWILPPRPRPGRKPVSEEIAAAQQLQQLQQLSESSSPVSTQPPGPKTCKKKPKKKHESVNRIVEDSPEIINLKLEYLAKLKEQALVCDYIEVINKQIKELDFIRNGFITVDKLNKPSDSFVKSESDVLTNTSHELETIDNMTDLDKFLKYLSKSSSIIHSATKSYISDTSSINSAIEKYLKIRSQHRLEGNKKQNVAKTPAKPDKKKISFSNSLLNENNLFDKLIIDDDELDLRPKKQSCGFCASGTPCLCLESDRRNE